MRIISINKTEHCSARHKQPQNYSLQTEQRKINFTSNLPELKPTLNKLLNTDVLKQKIINPKIKPINNEINEFSKDIIYKKNLLKAIGRPNDDVSCLRAVTGCEEYKSIVENFADSPIHYTPGISLITKTQDEYLPKGVNENTFRISLHNHTTHSDGQITVQEMLNSAAKYANKVANTLNPSVSKNMNAPFTIAITDHDTVEGCKEAVKIIAQNPEKYKNLKVVLGAELTVENKMLNETQEAPIPIHLVINGINPFDKELNAYLDAKKNERQKLAKEFFILCKNSISEFDNAFAKELSFEEAKEKYPTVKFGLNYPWYYIRDYILSKNNKIGDDTQNKALMSIIKDIEKSFVPKMNLPSYCMNMEDIINIMKNQQYGYMTIAHPALINIKKYIKDSKNSYEAIAEIFKLFKESGGDKALASEIYYPYFGKTGSATEWLNHIEKSVKSCNLIPTGGLDTHGKSIFYSNK